MKQPATNDRYIHQTHVAILSLLCLTGAAGCRGRAHEDVYRAKMANEIRVLEDQLYDADYQNRILRDELERAKLSTQPESNKEPKLQLSEPNLDEPPSVPHPEPIPDPDSDHQPSAGTNPNPSDSKPVLPLIDPPTDPTAKSSEPKEAAVEPGLEIDPKQGTGPKRGLGLPSGAVPGKENSSKQTEPAPMDLPAPTDFPVPEDPPASSELIPPGPGELDEEQIIPGPPQPPSTDTLPPGKTADPKDAKTLYFSPPSDIQSAVPDHLKIHNGLSGGHQFDDDEEIDGLYLVVTVADPDGNPLSLENFDVDAELTVVIVDPEDKSDDNRVGRWDFTPEEVREMVRRAPVDGLHIPVKWQDRSPQSGDVMVHIRMAAAEEEMRCQAKVRVEESIAVSNWLPRG